MNQLLVVYMIDFIQTDMVIVIYHSEINLVQVKQVIKEIKIYNKKQTLQDIQLKKFVDMNYF
jgi:hypothetical protein